MIERFITNEYAYALEAYRPPPESIKWFSPPYTDSLVSDEQILYFYVSYTNLMLYKSCCNYSFYIIVIFKFMYVPFNYTWKEDKVMQNSFLTKPFI